MTIDLTEVATAVGPYLTAAGPLILWLRSESAAWRETARQLVDVLRSSRITVEPLAHPRAPVDTRGGRA